MLLPWNVHRICSRASVNKYRPFQHPSYSLPKRTPSILLLFITHDKPERGDRPAGTTPSEAALAKCWKVALPCQVGLDITISFQLMKHFFLFRFLSWDSYPGVLISDPIFFPHLFTHSLPPHPKTIPSASCLHASERWDELQKGTSHIGVLYLNMGIK